MDLKTLKTIDFVLELFALKQKALCPGFWWRAKEMTIEKMVGATGFEPATSWSRTKRSSQTEPRPDLKPKNRHVAGNSRETQRLPRFRIGAL
jgi:hypothetical protein